MQLKQYIDTVLQAKAAGVPVNWEEVANQILVVSQQEIQTLTQQLETLKNQPTSTHTNQPTSDA
jgi:hypothetical protein